MEFNYLLICDVNMGYSKDNSKKEVFYIRTYENAKLALKILTEIKSDNVKKSKERMLDLINKLFVLNVCFAEHDGNYLIPEFTGFAIYKNEPTGENPLFKK